MKGKMDEEDIKDELSHAFKSLLLDIKDIKDFEQFFTLIEGLLMAPFILTEIASAFVNDFNSLSLIYRLISKNLTLRLNESLIEDVYTFTVKGSSRYDSYHFYSIMIDTSASRYSIAGLD
jgi:hypothetical protein